MTKREFSCSRPAPGPSTVVAGADSAGPVGGGTASWACHVGFPPSTIFPFTPPERMGIRNLFEFQTLMYRPLYWLGRGGQPGVDYALSLADPPEWSDDGRSVTVTVKPWKWSNGETLCANNVMFWINMMVVKGSRYGGYSPGYLPDNLTSYQKVAEDKVRFDFDRVYSKTWVLMNQLTLITPMPRAWDRTAHRRPGQRVGRPLRHPRRLRLPGGTERRVDAGKQRVPDDVAVQPGVERSKRAVAAAALRARRHRDLRAERALFRPEQALPGRVPPGADQLRRRTVPPAPGRPPRPGRPPGRLPPASPAPRPPEHSGSSRRRSTRSTTCRSTSPTPRRRRLIRQPYVRQALQCTLDQDTAIRDIFHGYGSGPAGRLPQCRTATGYRLPSGATHAVRHPACPPAAG